MIHEINNSIRWLFCGVASSVAGFIIYFADYFAEKLDNKFTRSALVNHFHVALKIVRGKKLKLCEFVLGELSRRVANDDVGNKFEWGRRDGNRWIEKENAENVIGSEPIWRELANADKEEFCNNSIKSTGSVLQT